MSRTLGSLPQSIAVPLAAALIQEVADSLGVRVLFIKGPAATAQGLRPAGSNADIDALVEPTGFEALVTAFASLGWRARYTQADDLRSMPGHSVTLVHGDWPCDLDLHYFFVGTFAEPQSSFEALWLQHDTLTLAARTVTAPSPTGHRLILTVNTLRDLGSARAMSEAERLAAYYKQHPDAWQDVAAYGAKTRSLSVLSVFARMHTLPASGEDLNKHEARQFAFVMRYHSNGLGNLRYRMRDPDLRMTGKVRVLTYYFFKPAGMFRLADPEFRGGTLETLKANLRRWAKGMRQWRAAGQTPQAFSEVKGAIETQQDTNVSGEFSVRLPRHNAPYADLRLSKGRIVLANAPTEAPSPARSVPLDADTLLTLAPCAREFNGETLYLLPLGEEAFAQAPGRTPPVLRVDASGQAILALLENGSLSANEIVAEICVEHELQPHEVDPGVTAFLQEMLDAGAIRQG